MDRHNKKCRSINQTPEVNPARSAEMYKTIEGPIRIIRKHFKNQSNGPVA
jgi:hypothetical protein